MCEQRLEHVGGCATTVRAWPCCACPCKRRFASFSRRARIRVPGCWLHPHPAITCVVHRTLAAMRATNRWRKRQLETPRYFVIGDAPTHVDAHALQAFAFTLVLALSGCCDTVPQEITKAERKALFEQQNKAKIEAAKAAKEQEKLSKKAESAAVAVRNNANAARGVYLRVCRASCGCALVPPV